MLIAIFYGIQIIGERDAGVLNKLPVTPTPRAAPAEAARRRGGRGARIGLLLLPVDDHRGHRARPRPADVLRAAITMPLFFGFNALYPVSVMPGWLRAVSRANPLGYQVDALRGLLLGTPAHLGADFAVVLVAAVLGIAAASSLLSRPAR